MILHVTPINDLHDHEDNSTCPCIPVIHELENGDLLVVHNSWDGREYIEQLVEDAKKSLN